MRLRDFHPVILAGGLGTRLRRVLSDLPKPMAQVAGKPFLEWLIRFLKAQGCDQVSLAVGYQAEILENYFSRQPVPGIRVTGVREPEPLGTAGGFRHTAIQVLRERDSPPAAWLVLNGDSLLLADLPDMMDQWDRRTTPAAILARQVEDPTRYGSLTLDAEDHLVRFAEKKTQTSHQPGWINAGTYFFKHDFIERHFLDEDAGYPLSFEHDVFSSWLAKKVPLAVLKCAAPFLDIGTENTLAQASAFIQSNKSFFPLP